MCGSPRRSALIIAAYLLACDSPPMDTPDAGLTTDASAPVLAPALPSAPAEPMLRPCPDGWREVQTSNLVTCDPWPPGGQQTCADGEAHYVGTAGCAPVGSPCPAGDFADGLPAQQVVYVKAGAGPGGVGTQAQPFATIFEAIRGVPLPPAGQQVFALSKGTHVGDGPHFLHDRRVLWGACVAQTTISSTGDVNGSHVFGGGMSTGVRNLTISGDLGGVAARGEITVTDVVISGVRRVGLLAFEGGTVTAERVVVQGTRPAPDGSVGRGISTETGGRLHLSTAVIEGSHSEGVALIGDVEADMTDVAIVGTRARASDQTAGTGITMEDGATLDARRLVLEGNRARGLNILDRAAAKVRDLVVRGTLPREADGLAGGAVAVLNGAAAEIERAWFDRNSTAAVTVETGASAALRDVVATNTARQTAGLAFGQGLRVNVDSVLTATRTAIVAAGSQGIAIYGGSAVSLTDVIVRGTSREGDAPAIDGIGLAATEGSRVSMARGLFESNATHGIVVLSGSSLDATDLIVRDTRASAADDNGIGLHVIDGTGTVLRSLFERNRVTAVGVSGDTAEVVLTDVTATQTESDGRLGYWGRAVNVQNGGKLSIERAAFDRCRDVGAMAVTRARLDMRDARISGTAPRACVETTCPDSGLGVGIVSMATSTVTVERFIVEDNALAGVQVVLGATMILRSGVVRGHPIGVNVQVTGFDTDHLTNDVAFIDNDINLDTASLPVPVAEIPSDLQGLP